MKTLDKFSLKNKVVVITGGMGLLGQEHVKIVKEAKGIPVIWDINEKANICVDITSPSLVFEAFGETIKKFKKIDVLINNACRNPSIPQSRFEHLKFIDWNQDLAVGLGGAFLCSQIIGSYFAIRKKGIILNIASDLGVIAPDQRIYEEEGVDEDKQLKKSVTYSVIKHGIIGLTKYLATYWADKGIRVNSLSPSGIYNRHDCEFVKKLNNLIPMGRMAKKDEYRCAVLFLITEASSYMTGANLIIDGGRTCW